MTSLHSRLQFQQHRAVTALFLGLLAPLSLEAIEPPDVSSTLADKAFRNADLRIPTVHRTVADLAPAASSKALRDLQAMSIGQPEGGRLDLRGGRWATLMPNAPLLPGGAAGAARAGNAGPPTRGEAWQALMGYLQANRAQLRIDPAELVQPGKVVIHGAGELIQIYAPRIFQGVPVRDSYLTAVINHGNLVLFGAVNWGDIEISTSASLGPEQALGKVRGHVDPTPVIGTRRKSNLVLVPLARGQDPAQVAAGLGYSYRLAWVVRPSFTGSPENWESLVDAHSGELLSFEDTTQYATPREVTGGVYPVSNDGTAPDGVEVAGWPMPFSEVLSGTDTVITDSGGNAYCVDGDITSTLSGPFVEISDQCGAISLTDSGSIDFGTSAGTDCATPGFGGTGNTHASRSAFYELNRIIEQAKGQLPDNAWLQQPLSANMNINNNCNATWDGEVNFYKSGGGCANTGEIAGVFDHEWGHGMDSNDVNPGISRPGEGIADLYSYFRLNTSCIGRGFRPGVNCSGFGDACLSCTGVREIDWTKRVSGAPHDVAWADAACGAGGFTPCGGATHCEGQVYAEAVYDLVERDLPGLFGMDHNTAFELGARLTYQGAGPVGSWFTCNTSSQFNGCAAENGYFNYLAADDDNGDLSDGTPHMSAIFAAFDRHGIACNTPAVVDSGCAGAPATPPAVTATSRDRGAALSWDAVTGASKYQVFRTDGVFGCDFGKAKIGETDGTTFVDEGLQNGRSYSYIVIPVGAADTCMGPASQCKTVVPAAGPNLFVDASTAAIAIHTGDGDDFLDNCESATVSFDVLNIGGVPQTNLQIDDVRPISHPEMSVDAINGVSPGNAAGTCASSTGSFTFSAAGLNFGDTVTFEVDVSSNELGSEVKTQTLAVAFDAEADMQAVASKTWDFESDLDGWSLIQGTFNQTTAGGGAGGSSGYLTSSSFLDNQCDQVRSPAVRLSATSALSAFTNYRIEGFSGQWWDRGNVAILDGTTRNAVSPSSGRLYNASGPGASCVTANQDGWASVADAWGSSTWSAAALGSASMAGKVVYLDIAYGTDPAVTDTGLSIDRVTLTDFELLVPDAQPSACNARPGVVITAPRNNAEFGIAESIVFTAAANDAEDFVLTPGLDWVSNIDGIIGGGGVFSTALSAGYHTVSASVTDSGGQTGSDNVHVVVVDPPACIADLVTPGSETVFGPGSLAAVKSVTIGSNTVLDGSGGALTIEAGKVVRVGDGVEFVGPVTIATTPTPCP